MAVSVSALRINLAHHPLAAIPPSPTRAALQNGARAVYSNIVFVLALAVACTLYASPLLVVGLALVPTIFIVRWLALSRPFPRARVNVLVLVLLLSVLWSMLRAPILYSTVLPVARILAGIATMYVVLDYAHRPSRLWNVALALVVAGAGIALAAPFLTQTSPDKLVDASAFFRPGLANLPQSNPNMIAGALAALVPLALALVFGQSEDRPEEDMPPTDSATQTRRLVGAVALLPILIMLFLLQARGAWIAALAGVLLYFGMYRRIILALFPLLILVVVVVNGSFSSGVNAPNQPPLPTPLRVLHISSLFEGRFQVWDFASVQIVREPLGHGLNTFPLYAGALASDLLAVPQRQNAHNVFLQVGFEVGLVGLAAFVALCAGALYSGLHAVTRRVKRDLAAGVLAALCTALLSALLEANFWGNSSGLVLWTLFGMAIALGRYGERRHFSRSGSRQTH